MSAQPEQAAAMAQRLWSYGDLLAMPEDGHRYELIDGRIHVSPPPTPLHQVALDNLAHAVRPRARAAGCAVRLGVGVRTPSGIGERYVIPDLVVVSGSLPAQYYEPAAVRVVAEVESPAHAWPTGGPSARCTPRPGSPSTGCSTRPVG